MSTKTKVKRAIRVAVAKKWIDGRRDTQELVYLWSDKRQSRVITCRGILQFDEEFTDETFLSEQDWMHVMSEQSGYFVRAVR